MRLSQSVRQSLPQSQSLVVVVSMVATSVVAVLIVTVLMVAASNITALMVAASMVIVLMVTVESRYVVSHRRRAQAFRAFN